MLYVLVIGGTWRGVLSATYAPISLGLLAILVCAWAVWRQVRGWCWHITTLDDLLPFWFVALAISTLTNLESIQRIAAGLWFAGLYTLLWYMLSDALANRLITRRDLVNGLLLAGVVIIVSALVQWFFGTQPAGVFLRRRFLLNVLPRQLFTSPAIAGALFNPNILGAFLVVIIPLAFAGDRLPRIASWTLGVLALFVVLLSESRGAQLGVAAALAVLLVRRMPRLGLLVLVALLAVGAALYTVRGDNGRLPLYIHAAELFVAQPITGGGLFTYRLTRDQPIATFYYVHAHNLPLHLAAELGIAGLVALSLTALRLGRAAWEQVRPGQMALLCGLAALGAQQLVDFTMMTPSIALTALVILCMAVTPDDPQRRGRHWPVWVMIALALLLLVAGFAAGQLPAQVI